MKCITTIDKNREEEVLIYAHKRTPLVDEIEKLAGGENELVGYADREAYKLALSEICCFTVEDNKVYALTRKDKLQVKLRLYQVEEMLDERFVKINQSCIANLKEIRKFDASVSGALTVTFKNGYRDYVSRRNVKNVKERLGVK